MVLSAVGYHQTELRLGRFKRDRTRRYAEHMILLQHRILDGFLHTATPSAILDTFLPVETKLDTDELGIPLFSHILNHAAEGTHMPDADQLEFQLDAGTLLQVRMRLLKDHSTARHAEVLYEAAHRRIPGRIGIDHSTTIDTDQEERLVAGHAHRLTKVDLLHGLRKRKIQEWNWRGLGGANLAFIANELAVYQIPHETPGARFTWNGLAKMKWPFANQPGPLFPAQQCGPAIDFSLVGPDYQLER